MASGNADVHISAGYTQNAVGFGWTNGVYLKLKEILHSDAKSSRADPASADNAK